MHFYTQAPKTFSVITFPSSLLRADRPSDGKVPNFSADASKDNLENLTNQT